MMSEGGKSALLIGAAGVLLANVPAWVSAIPNPTTRAVVAFAMALGAVVCAVFVDLREGSRAIAAVSRRVVASLRPDESRASRLPVVVPRAGDVTGFDSERTPSETPEARKVK